MRLALVGPAHPQKGGITQHTAALGRELAARGHEVAQVGWRHPYPSLLYPGQLEVDGGAEVVTAVPVHRALSWWDPLGWWRVGASVSRGDRCLLVLPATPHAPALRVLARRCARRGTPTTLVVHNVVPHEARPGDEALIGVLVRAVDRVVVHTDEEARRARELGARDVRMTPLPAALPDAVSTTGPRGPGDPTVGLIFGLVRPYKGVDVAIRALAHVPRARLVIAGEFWTPVAELESLAAELGVADRVTLLPGYVPAADVPELFRACGVVLAPYRSATGTQAAALARASGRPIIASDTGGLGPDVVHDVDGLLVPPGDVEALAAAWRSLVDPEVLARLSAGAAARGAVESTGSWDAYVEALVGEP